MSETGPERILRGQLSKARERITEKDNELDEATRKLAEAAIEIESLRAEVAHLKKQNAGLYRALI